MDEQRFQAYVRLIQQLLGCPQGQEEKVLQAHAELIDVGLLGVMEQYAAYLEDQGDRNANWLRAFAAQLGQVLASRERVSESPKVEAAVKFLLETLQLVKASQGDPQQVYPVWAEQQAQFNSDLLAVLPQFVQFLYQQDVEQQIRIAASLFTFGNLINQFPLGTRWLNVELGIATYQQVLQVYTRDALPENWAMVQHNLANAYKIRIRGERAANLEVAIAACKQALQVRTCDVFPEEWASTQNSLANAYLYRIQGERAGNLEAAIENYEQVQQVHTRDAFPEEWAGTQTNLAIAYSSRLKGSKAENIEKAITLCETVLNIRSREVSLQSWARTQNILGGTYLERVLEDRAENIEKAIDAFQSALQVYTCDSFPEEWANVQINLASAYAERIRGDRAENIEQSITGFQSALKFFTHESFPQNWGVLQNNLALAYRNRIRGKRADNIEYAITAVKSALRVRKRETSPEEWAITQFNLAATYLDRIHGQRERNLKRVIIASQLALRVFTYEAYSQDWAAVYNILSIAYLRFSGDSREDNLKRAIESSEAALLVLTFETSPKEWAMAQHNLGNAYSASIQDGRLEDFGRAILAYQSALLIRTPEAFPNECRRTSHVLADLQADHGNWSDAAQAYSTALAAAETLYRACILLDSKAAELAETADLPRCATYAYGKIGQLETAVVALEANRARGLSESLDRDRANLNQLQEIAPHLYEQYQNIANQLDNLESQQRDRSISSDRHSLTPEAFRNTATQLRSELETTIAQIRQVEGYADFLDQPNFDDIRAALQPKRPLIYLVVTSAGSLALVVTSDGIANLWLNDLTETSLQELLQTWFNAYSQSQSDLQNWLNAINSVTHQLWQPLMEPLVRHLKAHNLTQAILVPTGYLSLLPLHAAWTEDSSTPTGRHYALDDIHFTYAPNARSLTAAQAIATRTQANLILAIDNPTQDLPNSEREVQSAIAHFPQHQVLRHGEAAIASVREALQHCNILHLSCHGTANLQEPLTSGLLMSDGLLTLKDILDLNLAESATGGIRLAILSACETGLSGIENADEAISLPTGLLQAGVAGVIASLWAVSDLSTMLLITKFYDLWREQNLPPDQALRQAQIWLRDTTNEEKIAEFKAFIPAIANTRMSPTTAQQLYDELAWETKNERSFAHPFHWAAFNYTGI